MATDTYTYARMLHAAAAQPGCRIAVDGGVGYARAQSDAQPTRPWVPRWRGLPPCPVRCPPRPRRAPRSCAARPTSSWPPSSWQWVGNKLQQDIQCVFLTDSPKVPLLKARKIDQATTYRSLIDQTSSPNERILLSVIYIAFTTQPTVLMGV
jgi:hypothetical protein